MTYNMNVGLDSRIHSKLFDSMDATDGLDIRSTERLGWGGRRKTHCTNKEVSDIKTMYAKGGITMREIGEIYGLSRNAIENYING
jgi:DNA-binding CsgD family transcriptional regulator